MSWVVQALLQPEKSRACELVLTNVGHGGRNWQQRRDASSAFVNLIKTHVIILFGSE